MPVIKFKYDVPLDQTMEFESVYHPGLQLDMEQKQEVWETPGAFFVWMYVDDKLAGESYGIPLTSSSDLIEDLLVLPEHEKGKGGVLFFEHDSSRVSEAGIWSHLKGSLAGDCRR